MTAGILNQPIDVRVDFTDARHSYFLPENLSRFDLETGRGQVEWKRTRLGASMLFNQMAESYSDVPANEFPTKVYAENPALPFFLDFISPHTVRVRLNSSANARKRPASIMLVDEARGGDLPKDSSWKREKVLFIFLGAPREVIGAYTALTGRASMPPLWSFGLWMSRITYDSEKEVRDVAAKARQHHIPCDVIHLETGWFETDWECDYEFARSRFDDPKKMIAELRDDGFRVSLWQLPYFVPGNRLFSEVIEKNLAIMDAKGNVPAEDAVLDFSNDDTVAWYQERLAGLLRLDVSAIKTDFGEAAPFNGLYASYTTGFYEHNLYPIRYQAAAAEITRAITGDSIIWARAGWAGAQRNPVHWGGDAAKTFPAMAATLRAGLSIGVSGFSFWSHDIGGFSGPNDMDVYRNWVPFGMFTSHSRVHGEPPKEPWEFGDRFMDQFRRAAEMRYRLMPYIYAQARDCSERGLPMLRALFIEFPEDPGAWPVDDEYLFGSDLLVAPLFEADARSRSVYLPGDGKWIDYQTRKVYPAGWQRIDVGPVPAVVLVRDGAAIPHIGLAQSTKDLDWSKLDLAVFTADSASATGLVCLPSDEKLHRVTVEKSGDAFSLKNDPLEGTVAWTLGAVEQSDP